MLDHIRQNPRQMLRDLIERRRVSDPNFQVPFLLRLIEWAFLDNPHAERVQRIVVRLLGLRAPGAP
jgi:hypothetical protein